MVTVATETIKVKVATHRKLKSMAAANGEFVYELVERLVSESRKGKVQRRNQKDWPSLCPKCGCGLTSTDWKTGICTNCNASL